MRSNGQQRFGSVWPNMYVCTGGMQNRTKNMTTDGLAVCCCIVGSFLCHLEISFDGNRQFWFLVYDLMTLGAVCIIWIAGDKILSISLKRHDAAADPTAKYI